MIKARNVLCILHDDPLFVRDLCSSFPGFEYDEEYSGLGRDDRMVEAFSISDNTIRPTLSEVDKLSISEHQNVAYVLSPPLDIPEAMGESKKALSFVQNCFQIGARAVKCESSGLTHGKERWADLASNLDDPSQFWTWVRRPLIDKGIIYSCGMHLLGHPDVEIVGESVDASLELIDLFAMYIFVDRPGDRLKEGGTFSLSSESPRFRISKVACVRYEEDGFFYNPSGYWRLSSCDNC